MEINAYMNRGGEQYVTPQMEIVDLSSENAILTSCTPYQDNSEPDW
ncbi:MAG: hypothetical protein IJI45_04365 [Anaerolineaceae bacterium]|nr:hypothetical protein [Anaerolineaceae bacterium]